MKFSALSLVLLGLACAASPEISPTPPSVENGATLNGIRVNGIRVNGIRVNGIRVNGIRVNGIRVNGIRVNGTQGSAVTGEFGWAKRGLEGLRAGMVLESTELDGSTHALKVDSVRRDEGLDLSYYEISTWSDGRWEKVCETGEAILLGGRWDMREGVPGGGGHVDDPDRVTLACRGFALAKCVELGYRPWLGAEHKDLHQACTRMIRADYCGDGTPHTVDGVQINVHDHLGIQKDAGAFPADAEWTPEGARCTNPWWSRVQISSGLAQLEALGARRVPKKCAEKIDWTGRCGTPSPGPYLIDEVVAAPEAR